MGIIDLSSNTLHSRNKNQYGFGRKTRQFLRNKSGFQTFNGLMECVPWTKDTAEMGPQSQVGQTAWVYFPKEVAEFPINHKRCQFDSYNCHKLTLVHHFWLIYCHLVTILSELICNICYHNLTIHFTMVACVCMPIDLPLCQNTLILFNKNNVEQPIPITLTLYVTMYDHHFPNS